MQFCSAMLTNRPRRHCRYPFELRVNWCKNPEIFVLLYHRFYRCVNQLFKCGANRWYNLNQGRNWPFRFVPLYLCTHLERFKPVVVCTILYR